LSRLPELEQTMTAAGVRVLSTQTADELRTANRATAAALSARIAPGLAVLAGVFAGLGVALTVSSQRSVLGRDLTALRSAGVDASTVHRAAILTYLWPGLLAVVLGAAAGTVGSALVIPELPMLADPRPAIHNDLRLRLVPLAGCVALAAGALTAVVLLSVRRLSPVARVVAEPPGAQE
jgi:putative ABC transport system permease protein